MLDLGAVGGARPFIMPIYFPKRDKNNVIKAMGMVHFVLGFAQVVDRDNNTIKIDIYDSSPGHLTPETIHDRARDLVRTSRWLGLDDVGDPRAATFAEVNHVDGVRQTGNNTCGLYVILFAWARLLGIPLHPGGLNHQRRRTGYKSPEFLDQALEIVDLALAGHMDSPTIQAFFNEYGLSVDQDANTETDRLENYNFIRMDNDRFQRRLNNQQDIDQTQGPVAMTSPVTPPRGSIFTGGMVQDLLGIFSEASRAEVINALHNTGGDPDEAYEVLKPKLR